MDIVSRLKEFMEYNNLTSSQFADSAGIPRPTLSQILNGRNKVGEGVKKISSDLIKKIHDAFPSLNIMWLLFGDGDMMPVSNIQFSAAKNNGLFNDVQKEGYENQQIKNSNLFEDEFENSLSEKLNVQVNTFHEQTAPTISKNISNKKIESIMVFYSDNSFEIFKPSE